MGDASHNHKDYRQGKHPQAKAHAPRFSPFFSNRLFVATRRLGIILSIHVNFTCHKILFSLFGKIPQYLSPIQFDRFG